MSQEEAIKTTNKNLGPQLAAASIATNNAAEKSGVNLEAVKDAAQGAVAKVSCPSGLGVLTTHYEIMIGVFCAAFVIAFLILR